MNRGGEPLPVDRLHNLKNLLDMYEYDENSILVNEAIANAVDAFRDHAIKSGKIQISFIKKSNNDDSGYLLFHNNAPPMTERQFYGRDGYHKVSFSSKQKGKGIGFAGVGAKLFLASEQGGEIITITGKSKNDFMASKMYSTGNDVEFKTDKKYPLKDILSIPEYSHCYGTTYCARLTAYAYKDLKQKISKIIQFWWNYALIKRQIAVTVDKEPVSSWLPRCDRFNRDFSYKRQKIPAICFISKETIPEEQRHIVYTVFGKRILNRELDLAIRIKPKFSNRVFCLVDVSFLADQLTSNKENFKKSIYTNTCKSKIEEGFWKFLEDCNLLNAEFQHDPHVVTNDLTRRLDDLLNTKKFKDLNPFLISKKTTTLRPDTDGDVHVSEDDDNGSGDDKNGSGAKTGSKSRLVKDEDSGKTAVKGEKKSKGLRMVFTDQLQTHNEEARVETHEGAIVIDVLHPMYLRTKDIKKLQNHNLVRIVIESLIRHKNEEVDWDAKETMYRFRDLLHASLEVT